MKAILFGAAFCAAMGFSVASLAAEMSPEAAGVKYKCEAHNRGHDVFWGEAVAEDRRQAIREASEEAKSRCLEATTKPSELPCEVVSCKERSL